MIRTEGKKIHWGDHIQCNRPFSTRYGCGGKVLMDRMDSDENHVRLEGSCGECGEIHFQVVEKKKEPAFSWKKYPTVEPGDISKLREEIADLQRQLRDETVKIKTLRQHYTQRGQQVTQLELEREAERVYASDARKERDEARATCNAMERERDGLRSLVDHNLKAAQRDYDRVSAERDEARAEVALKESTLACMEKDLFKIAGERNKAKAELKRRTNVGLDICGKAEDLGRRLRFIKSAYGDYERLEIGSRDDLMDSLKRNLEGIDG